MPFPPRHDWRYQQINHLTAKTCRKNYNSDCPRGQVCVCPSSSGRRVSESSPAYGTSARVSPRTPMKRTGAGTQPAIDDHEAARQLGELRQLAAEYQPDEPPEADDNGASSRGPFGASRAGRRRLLFGGLNEGVDSNAYGTNAAPADIDLTGEQCYCQERESELTVREIGVAPE